MTSIDLDVKHSIRPMLTIVLSMLAAGISNAIAVEMASQSAEASSQVEERFLTNAVRSTSLATPGAASTLPLEDAEIVKGTILDTDGSPAANAEVWAASLNEIPAVRELAKTDEKGNFELHLQQSMEWWVTAYKDNKGADIGRVISAPMPVKSLERRPISSKLVDRCALDMRLLDESNDAIESACVYVDDGRILVSDAEGLAHLGGLAEGSHVAVVRSGGRVVKQVSFHCVKDRANRLDIRLLKANIVYGQILDAQGEPVPNAWLSRHGSHWSSLANDGTYTLADGRGRFAGSDASEVKESPLNDLLFDTMRLSRVGASGFLRKTVQAPRSNHGEPTKMSFTLSAQPTSQYGSNTMMPMVGGLIVPSYYPAAVPATYNSGEMRPSLGQSAPPVIPPNYPQYSSPAPASGQIQVAGGRELSVPPPSYEPFTINPAEQVIRGRVVDVNGRPISDVRIEPAFTRSLSEDYSARMSHTFGNHTDEGGVFNFHNPAPGHDLILSHEAFGERLISSDELKKIGKDIVLKPKRRISGRVVDESGNAVRDFQIVVEFSKPMVSSVNTPISAHQPLASSSQYTDAQGRFQFAEGASSDGRYKVTVSATGLMDAVRELVVSDEETHGQGDEFLFTLKKPRKITLKISSALSSPDQEMPIEHASVAIIEKNPQVVFEPSDQVRHEGTYPEEILEVTADASISVQQPSGTMVIQAPGYVRHTFEWNAKETEYVLKLVPEAEISVAIANTMPEALPDVELHLLGIDDTRVMLSKTVADRYRCGSLASGWFHVLLKHGPYLIAKKDVQLKAGEVTNVLFQLDYRGNIDAVTSQQVKVHVPPELQFSVNGRHPANPTLSDFADAIRKSGACDPNNGLASMTEEQLRDALKRHLEGLKSTSQNEYHSKHVIPIFQEMIDGRSWPRGAMYSWLSNSSDVSNFRFAFPTPDSEQDYYDCVLGVFPAMSTAKK